jgi:hypothetical protein
MNELGVALSAEDGSERRYINTTLKKLLIS